MGHNQFGIIAAAEVVVADNAPARRLKLLPVGVIKMRDGRGPFLIRDVAAAERVIAATRAFLGGAAFNFDYDHQTAFGVMPGVGGTGRAAGWCAASDLTAEDDGIYANNIEWTPAAEQLLRDREYRYISPLFRVLPTGEVERLRNAALVNVGGIDLPAVAAGLSEGEDMDLTAIAAALGLASTATVEEIAAAAADLKKANVPATSTIAIAAGLQAEAGVEEIAAAVGTLKAEKTPDLSAYVPKDVAASLKEELRVLKTERLTAKVDALQAAGIIPPAKHKGTLDWFIADEVAASDFFKDLPAIVPPGELLGRRQPGTKSTTLTADEIAACEMTGTSHEDFLKAKNAEIG